MNADALAREHALPPGLVEAAVRSPILHAALQQHVVRGWPLADALRVAHEALALHTAALLAGAHRAPLEVPPWPRGGAAEPTAAQVDALLGVLRVHETAARAFALWVELHGVGVIEATMPAQDVWRVR